MQLSNEIAILIDSACGAAKTSGYMAIYIPLIEHIDNVPFLYEF